MTVRASLLKPALRAIVMGVLGKGGGVVLRHKAHTPAVNMDVTPIMSEGLALEPQEGRPRVRP